MKALALRTIRLARRFAGGASPLAAVAGAMVLAGCQSDAERAAQAQAQAQQLASAGQYAAAQGQYDIAVRLRDDLPELWLLRARNQVALNDFAGAYESYRNVLDQDRTNREALDAVAQLSLASNRIDDARDYGDQILALAPDDPTGLLVQATVAFRTGRFDTAGETVARLLTIAPANEQALVLTARLLNRRGQIADAISRIEPIFQATGGNDELRILLAELYARQGDGRKLLAIAERDARDRPRDAQVQTVLGRRRAALGDVRGALAAFDTAHVIAPGEEQRAATARALAHADVAPAAMTAALAARKDAQADLSLAVAQYALDRGDAASALALLRPMDGPVDSAAAPRAGLLAFTVAAQGRMAEAKARAAAALAADGGQPYALMARALVSLSVRDGDAALRDARRAASDNNQFALAQLVLSRVLAARGDRILADKALFDANNADKSDPVALRQLMQLLISRGRPADGMVYVRRFTVNLPDSIGGWSIRRMVCARVADQACVARADAMIARLHGDDVPLPPVPPNELTGEQDYRDIYKAKGLGDPA